MHLNRITRRLSYSNVIASLALFVALGGASYAAVALPANSVGTNHLKKSAVSAAKLKRNAVSSAKVKDGSLERGDFASGTLLQGPQGPQGLQDRRVTPARTARPARRASRAPHAPCLRRPGCDAGPSTLRITKAKNVLGARRVGTEHLLRRVAPGIDPVTSGAAAGVDFREDDPEGNATAMADATNPTCGASEFEVLTSRIPTSAPVVSSRGERRRVLAARPVNGPSPTSPSSDLALPMAAPR